MLDTLSALAGLGIGLSGGLGALCVSLRKSLREAKDNQAALLDRLSARSLAEYRASTSIEKASSVTADMKRQYRTLSDPITGLVHMKVATKDTTGD